MPVFYHKLVWMMNACVAFLRATAATAVACLNHRNSVCPSVCHMGDSIKNGAS